jgi:hypothetical protein
MSSRESLWGMDLDTLREFDACTSNARLNFISGVATGLRHLPGRPC